MTDELLIKFLLNETTEVEGVMVQEWLDADPDNARYFGQFEKIWKTGKKLAASGKVDPELAWVKFKERTAAAGDQQKTVVVKSLRPYVGWLRIAAMLLLVGGAWMAYTLFGPERYTELTATNTVLTEQLPDGSELTLNKNSEISYAANFKKNRSVRLSKGDVFFNVAHDKSKPFEIEIDQVSVTVVGTSFNIKHLKDQTEVIVETGIVRVELNGEKIELHKGEKVMIAPAAPKLIKEQSTDELYNYYRSKLFIASGTSLGKLVAILNEAYGSDVQIADPVLAEEPIFTTLPERKSLEENLNTICKTLNLRVSRNENQILLSRVK